MTVVEISSICARARTFRVLAACLALMLALFSVDALRAEGVWGGEIRVAINSDILSTNPGVRRDGNTDTVLYHIAESLVAFGDDVAVHPMLAESIIVSEDKKKYTFGLRRGVLFHNGEEMTSAHVLWSWRRLLKPETGFRCLEFFDGRGAGGLKVENITAPDRYTVVFELNIASALFLHRMANIQCLTAILHPDSVDAQGEWIAPVATGPYRLGTWKRGQYVELEKFSDYVSRNEPRNGLVGEKIAYADRLRFTVTPDRIAAKASVYAGDIDLVFAVPLSAVQELELRQKKRGDITLYRHATLDWTVLLMQSNDPLLKDVRMRQAVAHAISPALVSEISTYGFAAPNPSAVQHAGAYHNKLHDRWLDYDPAEARRLARQAGYNGEKITIQTNRKFSYMYDNAVAIQAMLVSAGFNVKIEMSDWATQLSNFIKGDFQLSSFGYSSRSHPALLYGNFTGSKGVRKSFQWENPAAIDLISRLETTFDEGESIELLNQLHALMIKDVPLIGLYNDEIIDVSKSTLKDYEPWAFGRPRLWGVWIENGAGR